METEMTFLMDLAERVRNWWLKVYWTQRLQWWLRTNDIDTFEEGLIAQGFGVVEASGDRNESIRRYSRGDLPGTITITVSKRED
jgi:hypothetical protein